MRSKDTELHENTTYLVAVDFSAYSRLALWKARELLGGKKGRIIVLHVIDSDFLTLCIQHRVGDRGKIKKQLFLAAQRKLRDLLQKEGMNEDSVEAKICEGVPFIEINKKATELNAEMIIIGSCGTGGDMKKIFFGSTAEKVLRFIVRPVLCIPPDTEYCLR